jgi:hypothetical protein
LKIRNPQAGQRNSTAAISSTPVSFQSSDPPQGRGRRTRSSVDAGAGRW